jgi:hypothetical protein
MMQAFIKKVPLSSLASLIFWFLALNFTFVFILFGADICQTSQSAFQ